MEPHHFDLQRNLGALRHAGDTAKYCDRPWFRLGRAAGHLPAHRCDTYALFRPVARARLGTLDGGRGGVGDQPVVKCVGLERADCGAVDFGGDGLLCMRDRIDERCSDR